MKIKQRLAYSISLLSLSLLLAFGLVSSASASIYLEISGGHQGGLPIAVLPFQGDQTAGLDDIADIIRKDLSGSGQFKALPVSIMDQFPASKEQVQYPYWRKLGAESMVLGKLRKTGNSQYEVTFSLLDTFNKDHLKAPILLEMRFDNIRAQDLRALGHHISDHIFEKLIGIKGIFSTRIAYVSVTQHGGGKASYVLEVADHDGFNPKQLLRSSYPLMSPSWSPDGKQLAFVSFENNRAGVNVVDIASARIQNITHFPGINGAPSWSPDGQSLALVLSKDGNPKIYTLGIASKQLRAITEGSSIDTEPRWDPNGQSVVFTSNRGGKPQIYRAHLASNRIERLTFKGDYNARPSLTPDGKRLVMMHRTENGAYRIAVQNLQNGELKVLTHAAQDESPSLAPNGMMVLYGSQDGGRGILGAVSLDGRIKLRLPAREGNVQEPAWSPFLH